MTRVQKINKAIEILHCTQNLDAKQIHAYLADHKIYVEMPVIAEVILSLNYVKPPNLTIPRKSKLQIKIERLVAALRPLMETHQKTRAPWRYLASYLNGLGITIPGTGTIFRVQNLTAFLKSHQCHVRSGAPSKNAVLTYSAYCARIEPVTQQLLDYAEWIKEGN